MPTTYTYEGFNGPPVQFPVGTPDGACIVSAFYCSTTGPESQPPPPMYAGYSNQPSSPSGCEYNSVQGSGAPMYEENYFSPSFPGGDCTDNCP